MDLHVNNSEILIKVENVSFRYGNISVLEKISFVIKSGDFLAILGPNGSGKTTLIKIILGLLKPAQGSIFLMGKLLKNFDKWQVIGYVPQNAIHVDPFFPASAEEVVAMGLHSRKGALRLSKRDQIVQIDNALSRMGMESYKDWHIGRLSWGQQQRIFIARAIVNRPRILFLDEPTTGVDAETQEQFYNMLDNLNKNENITIVLITHETGIINTHVKQVACLNQKLIYHGNHADFCRSDVFKEMLDGEHHFISHKH